MTLLYAYEQPDCRTASIYDVVDWDREIEDARMPIILYRVWSYGATWALGHSFSALEHT